MDHENMWNSVWYDEEPEPLGDPTAHVTIDEDGGDEDDPAKGTRLRPFSARKKKRQIGFTALW